MEIGSPMRLAFYLSSFPVLSQTFIHRQIASLVKAGHEVDIIGERRSGDGASVHATVSENRLEDRSIYLFDGGLLATAAAALRFAAAHPAAAISAARAGWPEGPLQAAKQVAASARLARPRQYDALVAHFGPNAMAALKAIDSGMVKAPLVPVFHGFDVTKHVCEKGDGVYCRLFDRSAACLAISDRWAARLAELGCPDGKIRVHRVGIDVSAADFKPRTRIPADGALRLLSVARLVEKKGIEFGIRAAAIASRHVPLSYTIIGDGPLLPSLRSLAAECGVSHLVRFAGPLPEQEVNLRMAESDILLAPSVTASDGDEEGIPVVIMEAMALGLPVIATRHSGIPELVEDAVTGFLVPERDVDGLASKILQVKEFDVSGTVVAAREKVARMHSSAALGRELEALLESLNSPTGHS